MDMVAELAARTHGAQPGDTADLDALQALDEYGADAFAPLAQRFGWQRQPDGRWQLARQPRWMPGWVERSQEDAWLDLFEAAFGYRMDAGLYRWKYRHDPRPGMGAWRDGQLVAFYGAMTRHVLHFGKPERTVQIGDVMTLPQERGVMTRSGPFQIAASTFIERSVGYGRPFLFGFGFPTEKALAVAQKLGLYEQVDQIMELVWQPQTDWRGRLDRCEPLQAKHRPVVERLWQSMARRYTGSVIGLRDWDYLQDRFATHPLNRYSMLLVRQRFTGRPKGVLVVRDRQDQGLEILDLVGNPDHFGDLIRAARHEAHRLGRHRAFLWLTESHCHLLGPTSPQQGPLGLVVPANVWTKGPSADELRGRWWLTGGDMDFR